MQIPSNEIPNKLKIRIVSPREVIFSGEAFSVSSKNSAGLFDILPGHANFISLVENNPIIIRQKDKSVRSFSFPVAIIYNTNNQVNIYTDIEIR